MAHATKFTHASTHHMFKHYDRSADNISNDKIDSSRTHLNYNLAKLDQPMSQKAFYKQRLSEVRVQKRKDINTIVDWIVTAPKDLSEADQRKFFINTYLFLAKRYGNENTVSAYVHMDETTPHLHYCFIPITEDKKRACKKLCAKEVVTRADLKTFHEDLNEHLKNELNYEISILNKSTKNGNRSIADLKRSSAIQRLENIDKREIEQSEREVMLNALQSDLTTQQKDLAIKQQEVVKSQNTASKLIKLATAIIDKYQPIGTLADYMVAFLKTKKTKQGVPLFDWLKQKYDVLSNSNTKLVDELDTAINQLSENDPYRTHFQRRKRGRQADQQLANPEKNKSKDYSFTK